MSDNFEEDPEFYVANPKPRVGRGFRIVNVLIVLGIIAILIALFLPASRSVGPAVRRAQCANNLKQIALALHNYEQAYGALPPAYTVDANGRPLHSWRTLILPYMEQTSLYETIDLSKPWNDPANAKAFNTPVSGFRCLDSVGPPNTTTYLAIVAPNGCFIPGKARRMAEITDYHESTLMVIDAGNGNALPWMAPVDADESFVMNLGSSSKLHHSGGTNALFVDGSVWFLKTGVQADVRRALITISGNEKVDQDTFH